MKLLLSRIPSPGFRPSGWASLLTLALTLTATAQDKKPGPALTLLGHTSGVYFVAYSPDGKQLATAGKDRTLRLWDAATGREVKNLAGTNAIVYSVSFSPDGKRIASTFNNSVLVWDLATGQRLHMLSGHTDNVFNVAFSPAGKMLASCGDDRTVRLWDAGSGASLAILRGHTGRVVTIAFSPDGRRLASASPESPGGYVRLWDLASRSQVLALGASSAGTVSVVFSPDGKRLATTSTDRKVRVWEAVHGQEALTLTGHTDQVFRVAFSPDGRLLASCSGNWNSGKAGEVKVWNLATGESIQTYQGYTQAIWGVAFSPDGGRLATCSGQYYQDKPAEVRIWDVTGLRKDHALKPAKLTTQRAEELWTDLAGGDPVKSYSALWKLTVAPKEAVPLAKAKLGQLKKKVPPKIEPLIADLDARRFAVRKKALEELKKLGRTAEPALRKALDGNPSLQVRRSIEELIQTMGPLSIDPEEVLACRSVELLEQVGTREAKELLQELGKGDSAHAAREAKFALERLSRGSR